MKVALITGITGQDGSFLAELLLEKGYKVHGVIRRTSSFNTQRIDHLYQDPHVPGTRLLLDHGDLSDSSSLNTFCAGCSGRDLQSRRAIARASQLRRSRIHYRCNRPWHRSDFRSDSGSGIKPKFYQASSSEMFGKVGHEPQNEMTPFHPRSPYACAKVFAYHTTVNYREAYDLFACNGILFNHESERRGETFVTRKITRAATRIKFGLQDNFLGNLDAKRDWGYAKDYVEAMWLMMQAENECDDYVIATGETHSVQEFVQETFSYLDLDWKEYVEIDPWYYRPSEGFDFLQATPQRRARIRVGTQSRI